MPPSLPPLSTVIRAGLFGLSKENRLLPKCVVVFLCDNELLIGSVSMRRFKRYS